MLGFLLHPLYTPAIFAHHRPHTANKQAHRPAKGQVHRPAKGQGRVVTRIGTAYRSELKRGKVYTLPARGGWRAAWVTSNWQPGDRNADGTLFRRGITAAPYFIPTGSVVAIRFGNGGTDHYRVADREARGRLEGRAHFDIARPGNRSETAVYRVVSVGNGRYHASRRRKKAKGESNAHTR